MRLPVGSRAIPDAAWCLTELFALLQMRKCPALITPNAAAVAPRHKLGLSP